jgi:hypothetical protein
LVLAVLRAATSSAGVVTLMVSGPLEPELDEPDELEEDELLLLEELELLLDEELEDEEELDEDELLELDELELLLELDDELDEEEPPSLITTVRPVMLTELMVLLPPFTKMANSLKEVGAPAEVSVVVWVYAAAAPPLSVVVKV